MSRSPRTQSRSRRGAVLVCVVACLAVVTTIVATSIQFTLRMRSEARLQRQRLQAEYLCEAGVMRAVKRLKDDSSYQGETWSPNIEPSRYHRGTIVIGRETAPEGREYRVTVVASVFATPDDAQAVQRTHQLTFTPLATSSEEKL